MGVRQTIPKGVSLNPLGGLGVYQTIPSGGVSLRNTGQDVRNAIPKNSLVLKNSGTPPIQKIVGIGGHPVTQGIYNVIQSVIFENQLQWLIDIGAEWYRIDLSVGLDGVISNNSPNYFWGRFLGTSPTDIGYSTSSTDVRKNNFGIALKCMDLGIRVLPMVAVIASDPNPPDPDDPSTFRWWTARYATPQDAYNAGYNQMYNWGLNYGSLFTHVELGNEIELFTKIKIGNNTGTQAAHYDTERLERAVQYIRGMEDGIKAAKPDILTMFNTAGWFPVYLMDSVLAAAPTIDIVAWHWYSEMQDMIKNGQLPGNPTATNIFTYLANRYSGKKLWFTEIGYRWSANKTYEQNEQDQVTSYQSIMNDFLATNNGECVLYHELIEMQRGNISPEDYYGVIGWPNWQETNYNNPYKKLLFQYLQANNQ